MKKILLHIIILSAFANLYAQSSTPEMNRFNGGDLNLNVNIAMNSFGGGLGSGASGGIVSPLLGNKSAAVFSNPAELSFLTAPHFNFDFRFGVGTGSAVDAGGIKSATDDYLKDTTTFIYKGGDPTYTNINKADVFQSSGFSSASFAFPIWENGVFSVGFNYPLQFMIDMNVNGLETGITAAQDLGGDETTFDMQLQSTINSFTSLNMSELIFGFGADIADKDFGYLGIGLSLSRFSVSNKMNWYFRYDGTIVLNKGNEYYFNYENDPLINPEKGESNNFYFRLLGNYSAINYGGKIGFYFNPEADRSSSLNFSLVFDFKPKFLLKDENAVGVSYQPKFLTGRILGDGSESLDIQLDSMNLSKPHLTSKQKNSFTKEVPFFLPSSVTLGFDAAIGEHSLGINITKYIGKYLYEYDNYKIGKKPTIGLKLLANFKFADKLEDWGYALIPVRLLFLDIDGLLFQAFGEYTHYKNPYYRIGGGLTFGEEIAEGFSKSYTSSIKDIFGIPFPNGVALSRRYTIFDNIDVGVLIFGIPDLALKFSLGYSF